MRPSRIANPGPAGLFSFAATTFLLSLYNVNTRGIHTPNVVVGMAMFTGGLLQFIAGMWEFPRGNVFGATAFASYGCFWMSYAAILIPGTGIVAAYTDPQELANAIGLYLVVWLMLTLMLLPCVIHKSISFTILLVLLAVAFILLAVAEFMGGIVGIMTALVAYYIAMSDILAAEDRPIVRLPQGNW
ncbi:hypothetical protein BYT27DRAFT_7226766 [Phlegmacium glaucopus]|nr:hypothetical protein BYT27DRAFT_7226766 [Phlegmacium glaucopus]